ncbi:hypothetical protein G5C51_41230 [Streptomyces sp. A7024]|uniref:Uncharacterized protein n=1 Tax=Streptomyces coryli TaxID=1128680 RepID=A0A6G4UDP9_9ACTN|nr:hypothetical protein [Streptomyces coryli]NGN70294.1 hypothetical protein [Streptomyces coryli]
MSRRRTLALAASAALALSAASAAPAVEAAASGLAPGICICDPGESGSWDGRAKLPDGSTARFGSDIQRPQVRIVISRGDTETLTERDRSAVHDDWTYELAGGAHLKVTDGDTGRVWWYDFDGRLLDDGGSERELVSQHRLKGGFTAKVYEVDDGFEADLYAAAPGTGEVRLWDTLKTSGGHSSYGQDGRVYFELEPDGAMRSWTE